MLNRRTNRNEKADRLCAGRHVFTAVKSVFQSALRLSEHTQANHSFAWWDSNKASSKGGRGGCPPQMSPVLATRQTPSMRYSLVTELTAVAIHNDIMKVKNINGTGETRCNCGSWLDHWASFSGQPLPRCCAEEKCTAEPEVGAHVQKDGYSDNSWYIVPLCRGHNAEIGKSLTIVNSVQLVPANVTETCGQSA
jgi:hypothetical protein